MTQTKYPEFFNRVLVLRMQDKSAEFLGATEHDITEYHHVDVVCLRGHSCPAVTGAYLMVLKGLQAPYGTELPQRGEIEVAMQGARDGGTAGVTAAVVQLLTGAVPETGFGGIGPYGRLSCRNLLSFDAGIDAVLTLRRKDNGKTVVVSPNAGMYPFTLKMRELMPKVVGGTATPEELRRSGELQQARVEALLLDLADNPQSVSVCVAQCRTVSISGDPITRFRQAYRFPSNTHRSDTTISIRNASHKIGSQFILDDISPEIPQGGITAPIGPNGADKSTLLLFMARLRPLERGRISYAGKDVSSTPAAELAKALSILT